MDTHKTYPEWLKSIVIIVKEKVCCVLKKLNKVRRLDSDYVFAKEDGKPFKHWWVSRSFSRACKKVGINNFRFHDLRCSRLVQRSVDLYTVAALAGHKNIKITQRYTHFSPEGLRAAVRVLDADYNLTTIGENRKVQPSAK